MKDELTSIQGVGDKTAEKIMTVFEEHNSGSVPAEVKENLESAYDYYENEQYSYAGKFLRKAVEGLE